jgi:hypothetical protein
VKKKPAGAGAGAGATTTDDNTLFKIVKLDTAILPAANEVVAEEATATNMATLMAINSHMAQTNKKYSGGGGVRGHAAKGPSEVLINCFKINDLEIDENKV